MIVNRRAFALFAGGKQVWIAAAADRRGLSADHSAQHQLSGPHLAFRHAHDPVDTAHLVTTAVAGFLQVLQKRISMQHQRPAIRLAMQRVHGRLVRQPRRPGSIPRHRNISCRDVVLMRGLRRLVLVLLRKNRGSSCEHCSADQKHARRAAKI
jgi:hypothetical protein